MGRIINWDYERGCMIDPVEITANQKEGEQGKEEEHKEQEGGGTGMEETMYYTAADVRKMLGISRGKAYQLIKELNEELAQLGYIVLAGKVPKKFFAEKVYGMAGSN